MNISDLNYLEVVNSETGNAVTGAGNIKFHHDIDVDINKKVKLDIYKAVKTHVDVRGQLATAQADAEAFGKDALAETDAFTIVTDKTAFSYSEAVSALNPGKGKGYGY